MSHTLAETNSLSDRLEAYGYEQADIEQIIGEDYANLTHDASLIVLPWLPAGAPIGDLSDVDTSTAPTDNQVLQWDAVAGMFVPTTLAAALVSSVSDTDTATLAVVAGNLTADVILDPSTANLASESAAGVLVELTTIDEAGDVDTSTVAPTLGQALIWNGTNFVPTTITIPGEYSGGFDASGGTFPTVDAIDGSGLGSQDWFNVTVDGTIDGLVLTVGDRLIATTDSPSATDAADWAVITSPAAPVTSVNGQVGNVSLGIDDLSDVDTTTAVPAVGESLVWDGTDWVPGSGALADGIGDTDTVALSVDGGGVLEADFIGDTNDVPEGATNLYHTDARVDARIAAADIEDLNNVTTTAPAAGDLLSHDGTEWVNVPGPTPAQVFSDLLVTTTTTDTMTSKIAAVATALVAGTYKVTVSYGWSHNSAQNDIEVELLVNTASITAAPSGLIHKQEPKDSAGTSGATGTNQIYTFTKTFTQVFADGATPSFDLNYRSEIAGVESSLWDAQIILERII